MRSNRRKSRKRSRPVGGDWPGMLKRPSVTLAALREQDPQSWGLLQTLLRMWLDQDPELVRDLSAAGLCREAMHKAAEGLLDAGILRLAVNDVGFFFQFWRPDLRRYVPDGGPR